MVDKDMKKNGKSMNYKEKGKEQGKGKDKKKVDAQQLQSANKGSKEGRRKLADARASGAGDSRGRP